MSFLVGILAGFFGGLVGVGGAVIMIPFMVGVMKIGQHKAHGTSLVALVFTGISGAVTYALKGSVDIMASVLMAATAVFAARYGVLFAHVLPEWKLKRAFGGFLIFVSIFMLTKPYLYHMASPATGLMKVMVLLVAGVFTGFLSGMMGVGGGAIMVAAMVLFAGFGQHIAQGSSMLAMIPAGASGAYTYWRLGNVVTGILSGLIPGVLIGTFIGGSLALAIPDAALRVIFAAVLTWMGTRNLRTPKPQMNEKKSP